MDRNSVPHNVIPFPAGRERRPAISQQRRGAPLTPQQLEIARLVAFLERTHGDSMPPLPAA